MYFLYMIKNQKDRLYIGVTNNPERRLQEHNSTSGAEYTKNTSPFSIVFLEEYGTLAEARKREIQLKKWSRVKKEKLIELYKKHKNTKL